MGDWVEMDLFQQRLWCQPQQLFLVQLFALSDWRHAGQPEMEFLRCINAGIRNLCHLLHV